MDCGATNIQEFSRRQPDQVIRLEPHPLNSSLFYDLPLHIRLTCWSPQVIKVPVFWNRTLYFQGQGGSSKMFISGKNIPLMEYSDMKLILSR
jgi:hypothetical protein